MDFVLRSGLTAAVAPDATWRPLPERTVDAYITAPNRSALANELSNLVVRGTSSAGISPFHRKGLQPSSESPAGVVRCAVRVAHGSARSRRRVRHVGGARAYGTYASHLNVEIDVIVRFSAIATTDQSPADPWRVEIAELRTLIDAILATLTDKSLVEPLADLAGIDPIAVPPAACRAPGNRPPDHGRPGHNWPTAHSRRGDITRGHLLANPARDLATADDRKTQTADWLNQAALDGGLMGMQQLLKASDQ